MRKSAFLLALFAALSLSAASPANYSGKWALDKAASKNLSPFYEHVTAHLLDIKQTDTELAITVDITSEAHEPDRLQFTYKLDGSTVSTETQIRTPNGLRPVPTTLKAEPQSDGTILITIARELPAQAARFTGKTVETLRLAEDGKTLIIERTDDLRSGEATTATLVFKRS